MRTLLNVFFFRLWRRIRQIRPGCQVKNLVSSHVYIPRQLLKDLFCKKWLLKSAPPLNPAHQTWFRPFRSNTYSCKCNDVLPSSTTHRPTAWRRWRDLRDCKSGFSGKRGMSSADIPTLQCFSQYISFLKIFKNFLLAFQSQCVHISLFIPDKNQDTGHKTDPSCQRGRLAKYTSSGNASQLSGKHLASALDTNVCQINQLWKQYDSYSFGSFLQLRQWWRKCQVHQAIGATVRYIRHGNAAVLVRGKRRR
jgi:hypothetical protein